MSGAKTTRLVLLSMLVMLAACGSDNNKIGSTVKGTRLSVIEQTKALQADPSLGSTTPTLPPHMIVNKSWPQAGYDSEHSIPYAEIADHPQKIWEQSIGEGSDSDFKLLSHPVVDQGRIYTMDAQGLVRSFNAQTGDMNWEFDTTPQDNDDKAIGGGLAIDGHTLYATTGFGDVFALDAQSGSVKWTRHLLKPLRAAPTVFDDRVYVLSIDNDLNALAVSNGNVLWHQVGIAESATLMGASNPAVIGDNVIVAYNTGEIVNLRAQNGRSSWSYALTTPTQVGALPAIADIRGLPVIDHGRVYAISHSGRMAAIEQTSGERIWEADIGGIDTPVVAGDSVFLYGGEGQLIALEKNNGRALWVASLPKQVDPNDKDSDPIVWTGPILAGEKLWMVNSQGRLASFSPQNGGPLESIDLGHPVYVPPIVVDRTIYIVTDDGMLLALR